MPHLDVYVAENCFGCEEARRLADVVASRFALLSVRVVDLEREPHARPDAVVAVPSYVLDGRVISLGNPRQTELVLDLARLLATPSVTEGRHDSP
jgi:hypothetical protein